MIKTIVFDFGDVFLNLDKYAINKAMQAHDIKRYESQMLNINHNYEVGLLSTTDFLDFYQKIIPDLSKDDMINIWNSILIDFPKHRLEFIQELSQSLKYKLILLSNTNELHINWVKENISFFEQFKTCFDAFYLSYEIHLAKPSAEIFYFVLNEQNIKAQQTLFVDDLLENTNGAAKLGFKTWTINPNIDDVSRLLNMPLFKES